VGKVILIAFVVILGIALVTQRAKLRIIAELWDFMKVRKKWWLGPIVAFLIILSFIIVFAEGSALAPFIYTLF
jgi:hypothetical protein